MTGKLYILQSQVVVYTRKTVHIVEFKHISYFIEACNHNSISKAAESLYISQQALSRVISTLEKELGCRLFKRSIKGIELTADGTYLYNRFHPVVMSFQDSINQTASHFKSRPIKLPFCCGPGIIRNVSPELLLSFSEQYPNIEVEMTELSNIQCEQYIHEDKRRFGLMVASEWKHRQNHDFIMIKTEPSYLLVHKSHPLAGHKRVSLRQLKNERVLALDKASYFQEDLNRAVAPFNFTIRPFYQTADVHQQCGLVDKGLGVMLCIKQIYEESACKNVVLIPLVERTFDYNIAFIFQDYNALEYAAKQFIRFVIENIETDTAENA